MDPTQKALCAYIVDTHLDGDSDGMDASTPLLEWGVIDSIGMVDLLAFIERELGVSIPDEDVMPQHFTSVKAIAALVDARRRAA